MLGSEKWEAVRMITIVLLLNSFCMSMMGYLSPSECQSPTRLNKKPAG